MARRGATVTFNIPNEIKIKLSPLTKKEILTEIEKATIETVSKDIEISLKELKQQANIFLSSIITLDNDYSSFTQSTLNKIIKSQPEATSYLNQSQMAKERVYTQSLYMLAFRFDEFLSKFRKEDAERRVLYVFENPNGKLETYEMSYKELVVNADKRGRLGSISKTRLTSNDRQSIEESGIFPKKHLEGAQIAYDAVKNRLDRYFEIHEGQKQNGIIMWKKGRRWMLGNVLNTGDLKEAYTNFLFDEHENDLCKVVEKNPGQPKYYDHKVVDLFFNNYINKVTNLPAVVEEDIKTTNKQYGIKGKKASLPSLQQYVDIASLIIGDVINKNNVEQIIKETFNKDSARNISTATDKSIKELEKMSAEDILQEFKSNKI